MTVSVQVHRASVLFKLLAGFFMVFGYGKLFEPGPPYDDPFGGPDLLPELAQVAVIPIGLCLFFGMRTYKRIFQDEVGGIGKFGWNLVILGSLALTLGGAVYLPTRDGLFWSLLLLGNFIAAFGLVMIGIDAIQRGYISKWPWSPFIVGLTYTLIFLLGSLFPSYEAGRATGIVIFAITGVGWVMFAASLRESALQAFREKNLV